MKKLIIIGIILLIFAALFLYKYVGNPSEKESQSVKIAYNIESFLDHAPIIVGYEKGFFKQEGLDVELILLRSGGETKQLLASGNVDIGSAGISNFFVAMAKRAPVKIIAFSYVAPNFLYVRPGSGIDTFKDLEGIKIASRPGGTGDFVLRNILKKEGINSNLITFIDMDRSLRSIALMNSKVVDAVMATFNEMDELERSGAVILKEWEDKKYDDVSSPEIGANTVIAVNSDFSSKNPRLIEAFINAFIKSHRFIKEHPDEAAQIIVRYITEKSEGAITPSPEEITKIWSGQKALYSLWQEPNIWVDLAKTAKEFEIIDRELSLEEIFNLRFEKKLKDADYEIYGREQN